MKHGHAQVIPFFILNHQLDTTYLRRFVNDCADAGVDGIFLHPREGLLTPYLSEAWFEAIGACVDQAKRRGITAWLYDEFPYPSGVAGGKVVESNPSFAERHLRVRRHRVRGGGRKLIELGRDPVLHAFLSPVRGGKADLAAARDVTGSVGPFNDTWLMREWDSRYYYAPKYAKLYDCPRSTASHPTSVFEADVPAGEWELTVFHVRTGGDYIEPFGHYVDVSNRAATQKFIEFTHEEYKRRFGREFRKTIPGFFTDEPKYRNTLPWSDTIAAEWTDYQKAPRALLALATKEITWPFPRKGEPTLPLRKLEGADDAEARIRLRYRQTTFRLFRDNWARPISDWCARHGMTFTGHISPEEEWVQEAAICGSIAQLLKTFHIPGCDLIVPAVGDRSNPILNFTPSLAVSASAQQGRSQTLCEVYGANNYQLNVQDMKRIAEWLALFGVNLFVNHSLFGWIDGYRKYDAPPTFYKPNTVWQHFKTWADNIRATANRLGPLGVRAQVVIVRPMRTLWRIGLDREREARAIFERAMKLALTLQEHGIMFQWVDDLDLDAARVSGGKVQIGRAKYPALVHIAGTLDAAATAAVARLRRQGARVLSHTEAEQEPGPLRSRNGAIRVVQAADGGWFCINLQRSREKFTLHGEAHELEGYESRWITAGEKPKPVSPVVRTLQLKGSWEMRPAEDNVVVLKRWTLNGKPTKLAPYFDVAPPEEAGAMEQVSLDLIPSQPKMAKEKRLVYRTRFRARAVRSLAVVLEGETIRGRWTASLNGKPLTQWKKVHRYEPTNIEHALRARNGLNELEFVVTINKTSDGMIDPCRLFGDFRVENAEGVPTLVPNRTVKGSGDWAKLGFPHYSGTMIHARSFPWTKQSGERVELVLTRPPSDQLVVVVNGKRAGEMLWSPWRLDITRWLRPGTNRLELHVSNTLINLMYGRPRPSGLNGQVRIRACKR
jgi:hypothetical protein